MSLLRIPDYFQSNTTRICYPAPTGNAAENVFVPGEGIVAIGAYETISIEDNSALITELERINAQLKTVRKNPAVWYGLEGIAHDDLELYALFLCFCYSVWEEDVSQTEPIVFEYMQNNAAGRNDSLRSTCWNYVGMIAANDKDAASMRFDVPSIEAGYLQLTMQAEGYYGALKTQLLLHIYKGKSGRDGVDIAACRTCGKLYARTRKNSRLCAWCSSSTERSRHCRLRKKMEESKNAPKDNP
ncbi:MAG: hypothetical protein IKV90_05255 [Clostridia bacterium]|nr:hypothetical protein [Clostridia bacterium]